MNTLETAHYFPLSSQGNIYTLTILRLINNTSKLLVASLRREVIFFEYNENSAGILLPTAKEISFTYLPSGAEIISMTAFNKSETHNDFVIGITIIKNSNDLHALETYLNIYAGWEESVDFNMETISQNCLNNIELKFIPYHLTYTYLVTWVEDKVVSKEVVFLLSGGDHKVHVFQENKLKHTYKEIDCKDFFPEFLKLPSIVMWMDVHYYKNYEERLTAFGCECGYLRLCKINTKTNKILFNCSTRFNNTISTVKIYKNKNIVRRPDFINEKVLELENSDLEDAEINLVVTNTILPAVFFKDISIYGLKKYESLMQLEPVTVLSCMTIGDIDFDGNKEILIGTNNQEIITYKFNKEQSTWMVNETKRVATPVFGLQYVDLTGDGVRELVVLTMKGVLILQHNHQFVQEILEEKYKLLTIPNVKPICSDE